MKRKGGEEMTRSFLIITLMLLVAASMVAAEARKERLSAGKFEFGGGLLINIGRMAFGNNLVGRGEADHAAAEATIGYFITRGFEFQGGFGMAWLDWEEFGYSQTVLMLDGGPIFNLDTGGRLVPYTFARFGFASFSRSYEGTPDTTAYSDSKNAPFLRFGGGARIFPGDDWNIRLELRADKAFIEETPVTTSMMMYLTWLHGD
jgi:opacity protein-like surface antigen